MALIVECKNMDEKSACVISLFSVGKIRPEILPELKPLNVNKMFIARTVKRFEETHSTEKPYEDGRKQTATSSENVRKVRNEIAAKGTSVRTQNGQLYSIY